MVTVEAYMSRVGLVIEVAYMSKGSLVNGAAYMSIVKYMIEVAYKSRGSLMTVVANIRKVN